MSDRLNELGVAGFLNDDARATLSGLDVDAVHSIGLAGAMTPELLLRINELGAQKVADFAHEIAAGPFDPDDFEMVLGVGMDRVRQILYSRELYAAEPEQVVAAVREDLGR